MNRVTQLYSEGKISPVTPLKVFTAQNVEEAFRYFQKGQHIGKIVVSMPNDTTTLATATSINRNSVSFNPDAAYLLVGGLGGLGRAVSIWMAERGARHLVYLSRSGDDKSGKLADFFNELAAFGCGYRVFRGSVANQEDVERVVRDAKKPIRGVMQMAMELKVNIAHLPSSTFRDKFLITLLLGLQPKRYELRGVESCYDPKDPRNMEPPQRSSITARGFGFLRPLLLPKRPLRLVWPIQLRGRKCLPRRFCLIPTSPRSRGIGSEYRAS